MKLNICVFKDLRLQQEPMGAESHRQEVRQYWETDWRVVGLSLNMRRRKIKNITRRILWQVTPVSELKTRSENQTAEDQRPSDEYSKTY